MLARSAGLVPTDGRGGAGRRRTRDLLFLRRVPTPDLDLADLVGRGHHAAQAQYVGAHGQGQGVVGVGQAARRRAGAGRQPVGGNGACRRRPGPRSRHRRPASSGRASRCCCSGTRRGTPGWWGRSGPAAGWPAAPPSERCRPPSCSGRSRCNGPGTASGTGHNRAVR